MKQELDFLKWNDFVISNFGVDFNDRFSDVPARGNIGKEYLIAVSFYLLFRECYTQSEICEKLNFDNGNFSKKVFDYESGFFKTTADKEYFNNVSLFWRKLWMS